MPYAGGARRDREHRRRVVGHHARRATHRRAARIVRLVGRQERRAAGTKRPVREQLQPAVALAPVASARCASRRRWRCRAGPRGSMRSRAAAAVPPPPATRYSPMASIVGVDRQVTRVVDARHAEGGEGRRVALQRGGPAVRGHRRDDPVEQRRGGLVEHPGRGSRRIAADQCPPLAAGAPPGSGRCPPARGRCELAQRAWWSWLQSATGRAGASRSRSSAVGQSPSWSSDQPSPSSQPSRIASCEPSGVGVGDGAPHGLSIGQATQADTGRGQRGHAQMQVGVGDARHDAGARGSRQRSVRVPRVPRCPARRPAWPTTTPGRWRWPRPRPARLRPPSVGDPPDDDPARAPGQAREQAAQPCVIETGTQPQGQQRCVPWGAPSEPAGMAPAAIQRAPPPGKP